MITFSQIGKYGRFANQMFQYAALYGIARTRGYRYGVPYGNKSSNEYEHFCLDEAFDKLEAEESQNSTILYRIHEPKFGYDAGLFGIPDNSDLIGYFQTEKYFSSYRDNILKQFSFKQEIYDKALDIKSLINSHVISLHIRLGDYVHQQHNHPVCSIEYYIEALKLLPEEMPLFIFSDDIEKAKDIFKDIKRQIVYPESNNKYVDMCIMSLCNYHIIANSSYSWWGAWLSNSKKTIAPAQWFGNGAGMPKDWRDIYCENWIII